jgi:hypothetical protein
VAAFVCFFGGALLFINGPAANPRQAYFRMCLAAFGILLGVLALVLKTSDKE